MSEDYKHDQVRDHQFDGIQEFDNRLPNWWLWILYGTIVFSVLYWLFLHTFSVGDTIEDQYAAEMQAAAEAQLAAMAEGGPTNESLMLMASMDDRVAEGRTLFETYCVVCHSDQGQGNIGPNLTDEYWLHGGAPTDILDTIIDGVTDKGMAAWGRQLGPARTQAVTAYVLTLRNTNVPGKEPQGELYRPEDAAGTVEADESR